MRAMTDLPPRAMADRHHHRRQRGCERSTALMLAPALLLVVITLGAIAVDLSLLHAAKRSAYRSISAAADDAASMVDSSHLLRTGEVRLDGEAATRVALAHMGLLEEPPDGVPAPVFEFTGDPTIAFPAGEPNVVEITATVEVDHILLAAVPGMADSTTFQIETRGRMVT